jgi:hypothetical protein
MPQELSPTTVMRAMDLTKTFMAIFVDWPVTIAVLTTQSSQIMAISVSKSPSSAHVFATSV